MENGAYTGIEDEVEIDLLDLFWELLMQWKPILICMVLCGSLLMPAMYLKNLRSYRASLAASEALIEKVSGAEDEEAAEEMGSALEDTEQKAVDNAVMSYRQLQDLQYVYDSTIQYRLDLRNLRTLNMLYGIQVEDGSRAYVVCDAYVAHLNSTEAKKELAAVYGLTDPEEAGQMVNPVTGSAGVNPVTGSAGVDFSVEALIPEGVDAEEVADCIERICKEYQTESGKGLGTNTISLISKDERAFADTAIISARADLENRIMSAEATLKTAYDAFSDDQKRVYDYLISQMDPEADKEDEAAADESAAASATQADIAAPAMNPKYFLLGMLLGAFLYAGVYVVWWVMSPKVRQSDEMTGWLGVRPLGEIRGYPAKTAVEKFFKDKWVYSIRYKDRLDAEKALLTIRERLQLMPENANGLLFIQPTEMTARQKEFVDRIIQDASREIMLISPEEAASVEIEEQLARHPQVVLVSSAGRTPYKAVRRLYAGCRNYGADLYGHILIEAM